MSNAIESLSQTELVITIVTYERSRYFHAFLVYGRHRAHAQSSKSPMLAIHYAMHNMIGAFVDVLSNDDLRYFQDEYEGRAAEEHYSEYPLQAEEDHCLGVAEMLGDELARRFHVLPKGEFE